MVRLASGIVAVIALAISCGGGSGGAGTGGMGGAGGTMGAGGQGGSAGQGGSGGAAPRCGSPAAVVSCFSTSAETGDICQESLANSTANAVRFFCSGADKTLTEGAACPRNAQLAGCCADPGMTLANCYYTQAEAQAARTSCAQAGNSWCDP